MIIGLDHVQITAPAGCEAEARRFYGGLLGLREVPKPAGVAATGGAWFVVGAQRLHIGVEQDFTPARKAHPGLTVDGGEALDALAQRLADAGVELEWDERLAPIRRFYTRDPWGNRLELTTGGDPA